MEFQIVTDFGYRVQSILGNFINPHSIMKKMTRKIIMKTIIFVSVKVQTREIKWQPDDIYAHF